MNHRYLVINRVDDKVEELELNDLIDRIKCIGGERLVFAYDLHAGFNIPSNVEFRDLLERVNKRIKIDFAVIDERRQSNDKPYSPTSVHVVVGNRTRRKSICPHRHAYVSEIPFNGDKIFGVYRELMGDGFQRYSELLSGIESGSVGEFLANLTESILTEALDGLEDITIRNVRFDKHQGVTSSSHPSEYHRYHDVLYLGQHKAVHDKGTLNFLVNRFKHLGEKPYYLVVPIEPQPYFKVEATPK